jgi:arsenite methyltransferase
MNTMNDAVLSVSNGEISTSIPAMRPGGLTLTRRFSDYCSLKPGDLVLDAGCGEGATVGFLSSTFKVICVGIDISPEALMASSNNCPGLSFIRSSSDNLPFKDHTFAAVYCECVLSLSPDPINILKEFQRVLVKEGHLCLTDIYLLKGSAQSITPGHQPPGCGCYALSREQILKIAADAGFQIAVWEDHSDALLQLVFDAVMSDDAACSKNYSQWISFFKGAGRDIKPGYYLMAGRKC